MEDLRSLISFRRRLQESAYSLVESICLMRSSGNIRTRAASLVGSGSFLRVAWRLILEAASGAGITSGRIFSLTVSRQQLIGGTCQKCRAAFSASQFCDSSSGRRGRYSHGAGIARSRRRADNDDLFARDEQTRAGGEESGGWDLSSRFSAICFLPVARDGALPGR